MFVKNTRGPFLAACLILMSMSLVLTGCGAESTSISPPVVTLNVSPGREVPEGDGVAIVLETDPYEPLDWEWTVTGTSGGTLNINVGENVVYTAGKEGVDIVEAKAEMEDGTTLKQTVTINVIATVESVTVTETPIKAETLLPTKVTLTSLQDGQKVPCMNIASGTYPIDLEEYIWPVVYITGRFYPQDEGGKAAQKIDGKWYQTVRFGDCDDPQASNAGAQFQLIIITANASANAEFERYLTNAQKTGNWEGMLALPSGADEQLRIVVTRE